MSNKRKIVAIFMLISWMILIFYMSHQPADISSKQSDLVIKIFESIGINLSEGLGEFTSLIVRKVAHFSEYFILYILTLNVFRYKFSIYKALAYSLIFIFLYACSDEIHQWFVPGRAMAFKDVLIDTFGGTVGMCISYITLKVRNRNSFIKKTTSTN